MIKKNTMKKTNQVKLNDVDYTFNVCYLREYMDPEQEGDFFNAYETVYRNVPYKFKDKFKTNSMKMKIVKYCDWNYKETATNFAKRTNVKLIDQDKYYQTFADVFGDCAEDNKSMFNDYGQSFDRQSLRKDFNPKLTKKFIKNYTMKGVN
jgi:hypothetical protein